MHLFDQVSGLMRERYADLVSCKPGNWGRIEGLEMRCEGQPGFAFLFESNSSHAFLLTLHERDEDPSPEVWTIKAADDVARHLHPWAFPPEWRPPARIDRAKEKRRLAAIAAGLATRGRTRCRIADSDPGLVALLTDEGRVAWEKDVASVSPERIRRHFPWDRAGQLAVKTAVVLNAYDVTKLVGMGRTVCLAAVGPARRRDDQEIRVELASLNPLNHMHRWDDRRWLWQPVLPPSSEFWLAGSESGDALLDGSNEEVRKALRSLDLLDDGRIEEALALYDVTLSDDLHRLLGGQRIRPPACCAHADHAWSELLAATLRQSAPWLLARAVVEEAARLRGWAARKKGRRVRPPCLKLAVFPGQFHSRKASLMLTGESNGRGPRLVIEATASNARAPDTWWKRPIEVDFLRHGLRPPDDSAGPGP